jgi:uncharacterized membrane protein
VLHTLFTLRYAQLFYAGHDGGIDFNEDYMPDYADFANLAFTIGVTFQIPGKDLATKVVRQTALRHALMSYLFGAIIVGLVIDLMGSLLN